MAVGPGIAPPRSSSDTTRAIKSALRSSELAPATIGGQLATFAEIMLAIGLASAWLDRSSVFVVAGVALGIGILVGLTTPIGSRLIKVSGVVISLCALFVLIMVHALADGRLLGDEPWLAILAVGLVPIGLDWRVAARLRARTVCSGILIVPLVGAKEDWAYAGAVVWFVGALVTLWLLERDVRNATMRPVRLTSGEPGRPASVMDVVRTAAIGLALGLVIALLFSDVRCSSPTSGPRFDVSDGAQQLGGSSTSGSGSSTRIAPPLRDLDAGGREYEYRVDEQGRRYVTGSDGSRLYVGETGDRTILRRDNGDTAVEVDENGVTVYDENGNTQTYTRRSDGRYEIEGTTGERYTLGVEGGRWVLRDGSGREVAGTDSRTQPSPDHLYVRDPEGNVLIPGADGDGNIPLPPGDSLGSTGVDRGFAYERDDEGRIVVREPDGSTRAYDRDAQGRDRMRVDDQNGTRTYVYDDSGDTLLITEYDERGRDIGEYFYDTQGRLIDESQNGGSGNTGSSGSSGSSAATQLDENTGSSATPWGWISGGLVVVAAIVVAALLIMRRRPMSRRELGWAERLSARLDLEGSRRGRVRGRSETVREHASALADGALPDARVARVGQMVSAALFGRGDPPAEARRWAEGVVDEASNAHPPPARRSRWSRSSRHRTSQRNS